MTTGISGNYNNYYQNQQQWLQQPYQAQNTGFQQPVNFTSAQTQATSQSPFDGGKDAVEDGKDDGNIGFWKATGNFFKGVGKFFTGMFTDENGDFSLWQTLKTAAIAVGVGAVCVLTAGTAVPALIAAGGVALAGTSLAKGVYNVATAETDAEAENAWQQVGSGTTATVLAVTGAKAVAKGMHAEQAAAGEFDGIAGAGRAVKTVFSDSYEAASNSFSGIKTAANGATVIKDKFSAVKEEIVSQGAELKATAKNNFNEVVYGTKGKVAADTEKVAEDLRTAEKDLAKIADKESAEYVKTSQKVSDLRAKHEAMTEINRQTSYKDANEIIEQTKSTLESKKTALAETTDEAAKANLQSEVNALEAKVKAQKSVLSRRTSEAEAIRDRIVSKEKALEKAQKAKKPDAEKIANLKRDIETLKSRQDFEIPTQQQVASAKKAANEAQSKYNKLEEESWVNDRAYAGLDRAKTTLDEATAAYKEVKPFDRLDSGFGYERHIGNEMARAIYNNPGAKWMTINAAGKNSQTTLEARFLSQMPPETRAYYSRLPESQKQALLAQFKAAA